MMETFKTQWALCLLLGCAPKLELNGGGHDANLTELRAERVTATVKRGAVRLVHIQTEREAFVTTPEHPFATARSGWVPAGQLVPGDRVVSARFGTVRIVSLRSETPAYPVSVFNLTVDPSHAYLVGTDQVLVHNTRCKGQDTLDLLKKRNEELREAQRKLEELEETSVTSPQRKAEIEQQIAELESSIGKIKKSITNARARLTKAGIDPGPTQEQPPSQRPRRARGPRRPQSNAGEAAARRTSELQEIEGKIAKLQSELASAEDKADIQKKIDELKKERRTVQHRLAKLKQYERKRLGQHLTHHEQLLQRAEADYESVKQELDATQSARRELDAETPRNDAEKEATLKRKAELEKRVKSLEKDLASAEQIRAWEREVAEFERARLTNSEDPGLEQHIRELKAKLAAEKARKSNRVLTRRKREDSENVEYREARARAARARYRTKSHFADSQRPRDPIELLEEELAALREQPASPSRDERISYVTVVLQTRKNLVEVRREEASTGATLNKARARRKELVAQGKDTKKIDERITRLSKERERSRAERIRLRAHALLLGMKEVRRKAPHAVDEVRFRAFEQAFADPTTIDERRLAEFEHQLADLAHEESDTLDAEFFEAIWREAEAQDAAEPAAEPGAAQEVDPPPPAPHESPHRTPPSAPAAASAPAAVSAPAAAAAPGFRALQNELRAQRHAFEMEDMDLANQHAALSQTLPRAGSSRHAEAVQRLNAVQAARLELRRTWRQRMQTRLDRTRQELQIMESIERFRDPIVAADLAQQIALLEHEVQHPSF